MELAVFGRTRTEPDHRFENAQRRLAAFSAPGGPWESPPARGPWDAAAEKGAEDRASGTPPPADIDTSSAPGPWGPHRNR